MAVAFWGCGMGYLSGQLDYIFFFYGLSFLFLSAVCFFLRKPDPRPLAWAWLALFGLAHGLNEWLDLAAISFSDSPAFSAFRLAVMAVSFLFLFEFGRRSRRASGAAAPGAWVHLPLLLLAALCGFCGLAGLNAGVRYFLGLTGALLSARAVYLAAAGRASELRVPLLLLSAGLGLYALASGAVGPESGLIPAKWVNYASFSRLFGFPVQLLRGLLALFMTISAWIYYLKIDLSGSGAAYSPRKEAIGRLALLTTLIILSLGWVFTNYLGRGSTAELDRYSFSQAAILAQRLDVALVKTEQTAGAMAGSPWVLPALKTRSARDLELVNSVLDRYQRQFGMAVCYLIAPDGVTIASSNRKAPDSFVGMSYAFRPYFRAALAGRPGRYFALGVTSGTRGYYASSPIRDGAGKIIGVVVAKADVDLLGEELRMFPYVFLASPEGIIFLSSRPELLFRSLWPVSENLRAELSASKQFGSLSFDPLLDRRPANGITLSYGGKAFYVTKIPVGKEGWELFSFAATGLVMSARLLGILITAVFCLFVLSAFLILMESETKRELAEKMLELKEEVRTLSGILPICASCKKIRNDKGYWDQVESYVTKHTGAIFTHGICPSCVKKLYPQYAEDENGEKNKP